MNGSPRRWWQQILYYAIFFPSFLIVLSILALLSQIVVEFVHLSLVYGVEPVVEGRIYFSSIKPELIVSNGDHLSGFSHGWHFVAIVVLWFSVIFGIAFVVRKLTGDRLIKWKWED